MTKAHTYAAPLLGLATLAALGLTARPAAAQTTINFSNFDQAITDNGGDFALVGPTYSTKGFTFTAHNGYSSYAAGANSGQGDGETSLYGNYSDYTSLTQDNGQTFSLNAIDLGPRYGNLLDIAFEGSVIFTGMKADGTTVTDTAVIKSTRFQKFDFTDLTDLQSLTLSGVHDTSTGSACFPLFDNVVLTSATSPAPEPSQMAGLGLTVLGLGGLLLRARKRKACEPLSA